MPPRPVRDEAGMREEGYLLEDICYKCPEVGAQRLTVEPGKSVTLRDGMAYGFILLDGYGACGGQRIETPALIRYGQLTRDEFFVTADAARGGVVFHNLSESSPLVLLRHFAKV